MPAPFHAYMKLICYDTSGQALVPPDGTHRLDGKASDPVATHGIKLLMECDQLCQGVDKPWILGMVPDRARSGKS